MHLHILAVFGDYAYIASFGIIIRKMINFDLKQKKKIPEFIKRLETQCLPLSESMKVVQNMKILVEELPDACPENLKNKFNKVIEKNPGFSTIEKVNEYLNGSGTSLPTTIDVGKSSKFKYCPMTSVDVERSFSSYKYILEDRRHRFTMENLGKIMVLHFNQNQAK
uniref:HAT C-terminal dimerisation domain-containing protein n=2 Tax=Cacopsylla melanoneura TaxID=428564 RepID=A0A8D8VGZ1_9HEMI